MKRAAIGAAGITTALLVGMTGEASAQPNPQCETVYDETEQGDSSAALRQVIGEYAAAGVEVHVQIYQDLTDDGVANNTEAEGFADRLAQSCGWSNNNVNVLVSLNPRAYVIDRNGRADRDISQSSVDNAEVSLGNDLRDGSTTFQNDAANLLERINPYDQDVAPAPVTPRPTVVEAPSEPLDIPVKEIAGGMAGLGLVAAVGARLKRAHSLKKGVTQELQNGDSNQVQASLTSELFSAEELLRVLPDDDAPELRKYNQEAGAELTTIIKAREELEDTYRSQRKRIWPNLDATLDKCLTLEGASDDGQEKLEQLQAERAQVEKFITEIDEKVAGFSALVKNADDEVQTLNSDGWDLGRYLDTLNEFKATQEEIAQLRAKNYIEKPAEIIEGKDDQVIAFVSEIQALPRRREEADQESAGHAAAIETFLGVTKESNQVLDKLRVEYHPSCSKDIGATDEVLAALHEELLDYKEVSAQWAGIKTVTSLEDTEKSNVQFKVVTLKIEDAAEAVHERARKLEYIRATLPEKIAAADQELGEAYETAFDRYRDDVEDETRDRIIDLQAAFKQYKADEVSTDKPKYLELAENVADYKSRAADLTRQAVAEKEEMDDLRDNINDLERQTRAELGSLESYISSHRSDVDSSTESRAASIRLLDGDTNQSRQSLRNQVEDFRRLAGEIEDAEREARADVRREEERRAEEERQRRRREEEERQRRQRAEDDRRRQQQAAAAASITSYSSGSSFSSGGGGGSTDSGSW